MAPTTKIRGNHFDEVFVDGVAFGPEEELLEKLALQRSLPLEEAPVPVVFLTGIAGTGKTTLVKKLIEKDPKFAILTATTGIAAVNLDATTVHSTLGFSDYHSMLDSYSCGRLAARIHKLAHEYNNILIDEASMLDGRMNNLLYKAVAEVNEYEVMKARHKRMGIILTGDFCQLPPIKSPWVFEDKEVWPFFDHNTVRLTTVWRQENAEFLKALNHLRAGDGSAALAILKDIVHWKMVKDHFFQGTTIVATNPEVNRHNDIALGQLNTPIMGFPSVGWGSLAADQPQRLKGSQWKHIPEMLKLKIGAYVMILANSNSFGFSQQLEYANGSFGIVREVDVPNKKISVELTELGEPTGRKVWIPRLTRFAEQREEPNCPTWDEQGVWDGKTPYFDHKKQRWILGGLTYIPLRLGYASTVHKCQGLTLEKVQIDTRAHFFGEAGMAYVALSRCRTPEGTTIVGAPQLFAAKVKIDERVREWL